MTERHAVLLSGQAREGPLVTQARSVLRLVEAVADDDLDALCVACDAAERLADRLGRRIQAVVSAEDAEASEKGIAECRMNDRRICQGG